MVAIICDRCGSIIRAGDKVGYIAWNFREGAEGGLVQDNPFEMSHFCCKCMEGFKEYIEGKLQQPEASEGEAGQGKAARKHIDIGRIMALRAAGWKNKEIAEDMGLTGQQVTAAIARFKKSQGMEKGQEADGKEVGNA